MPFFYNKRKDFSIQPPKQEVSTNPLFVTDSANIDFTLLTPNNLTADLTLTGVIAGTYGDATNVPQFTVDAYGRITGVTLVPISGGGGTYTVNNGLTENPANNFQWGGTLIQNTPITANTFYTTFSGSVASGSTTGLLNLLNNAASPALYANNTSTGVGIRGNSNSGIAGFFQSSSGLAGYFLSLSNIGLFATSYGAYGGVINRQNSAVNTVLPVLSVLRTSSGGAGTNGIGASINFEMGASNGGTIQNVASRLISIFTDANVLSLTSRFSINNINNTVDEEQLFLLGTGQLGLNKYGINTFAGTPAYALGVDASGNVIEFTPAGGSSIVNRGFNIGNGNIVVAVGLAPRALVVDFNCNIISWTFTSTNITGSMSVDIIRKNGAIIS